MATAFEQLKEAIGEIADLRAAQSLMSWDQQVYMPPRGAEPRSQALATLSTLSHDRLTGPQLGALLGSLNGGAKDGDEKKFVDEVKWERDRASKLPRELVHEMTVVGSRAYNAWVEARTNSNFKLFEPHLEKVVELQRRAADLYGFEDHPWDALAQSFERGITAKRLREMFAGLRTRTAALVRAIAASKVNRDFSFLDQTWPAAAQWEFSMLLLKDVGFDLEAGRLDKSPHPFTSGTNPLDVRLTTRVKEKELFSAMASTLHEAGHGMYEQGLRVEDMRTPLGEAPSLGLHESQSRLWEIRIGQSKPFWKHYLPLLKKHFPGQLDSVDLDLMYAAANRVEPSYIRVEADEVTYNLHIILRFELEQELIGGTLAVRDLPEAWNAKMKELLGITPRNDAEGCLQDVHWSDGGFGYFPCYSLGNVYNAMLMEKIQADIPNLWSDAEQGRFTELLEWLRVHVHRVGRRHTAIEIMEAATGRAPSSEPLLSYLEGKYRALYQLG